jgi:hypothetical protein
LVTSARAIPGKVRSGFPSGIAKKQKDRAVLRFREKLNRSNAEAPQRTFIMKLGMV